MVVKDQGPLILGRAGLGMVKEKDAGQVKARLDEDLAARVGWIFFCDKSLTQQSLIVDLLSKWIVGQEKIHGTDPRRKDVTAAVDEISQQIAGKGKGKLKTKSEKIHDQAKAAVKSGGLKG